MNIQFQQKVFLAEKSSIVICDCENPSCGQIRISRDIYRDDPVVYLEFSSLPYIEGKTVIHRFFNKIKCAFDIFFNKPVETYLLVKDSSLIEAIRWVHKTMPDLKEIKEELAWIKENKEKYPEYSVRIQERIKTDYDFLSTAIGLLYNAGPKDWEYIKIGIETFTGGKVNIVNIPYTYYYVGPKPKEANG